MPVIYIDILFFINLVLDSVLLILSGRISGKEFSPIRIIAGGIFGGLYSISLFFAQISFLGSGVIAFAVSAVMIAIVYCPLKKMEFLRLILGFYLSSFLLGGALSAVFYFSGKPAVMSNGIYYFPFSTFQLLLISLPLAAVLCFTWKKSKNRLLSYGKYCSVNLTFKKNILCAEGILDSGCSLKDPYLCSPVIIIDSYMAENLLGNDASLIRERNVTELLEKGYFRLIPYSTINSSGDCLIAFTPDLCQITTDEKQFICNCSVAVSLEFSGGKAIINPEIFAHQNYFGGTNYEL